MPGAPRRPPGATLEPFGIDFGAPGTSKIVLPPTREHDFQKIWSSRRTIQKDVQKMPPGCPRAAQISPRSSPRSAKRDPRRLQESPGTLQEPPRAAQEDPRRAQESHWRSPEGPKRAQRPPRGTWGASQEASRSTKKASKKPPPGNKHMSPEAASHKPTSLLAHESTSLLGGPAAGGRSPLNFTFFEACDHAPAAVASLEVWRRWATVHR